MRIAGVEVGKVKSIEVGAKGTVHVEFSTADSVILTEGTRAAIRWADMIGGRYLSLEPAAGSVRPLEPGATIPLARPRQHSTSMRSSADSGRCSGRWTPIR